MRQMLSITRKEVNGYFSSAMALIFVFVFLAATLYTFYVVDGFFARGIADVRSLFRWMPRIMIFLVAALTMRQWSEEQQAGTLEILFTMPIKLVHLVLGKFLAVLTLVVVALALTLVIPITVSMLGDLDIGPVIGGYLAAILMSSAYIAIGLFVSSRTGNQIVALILTVLLCGLFLLVGSRQVTEFLNLEGDPAAIVQAIGSGTHFESIERGVIDIRDLIYYLALTGIFLTFNIFSLDSKRWGQGESTENYRFNAGLGVTLLTVNLLIINVLAFPFHSIRLDLTEDREYSLSPVTEELLNSLQEPLLIRFYVSENNHSLLQPLIPRITDMLEEYRAASGNNVRVEIIDPFDDPVAEQEANQTYGIRSSQLQDNNRYGVSLQDIYFDILIRYGDQTETLNYGDLIQVDRFGDSEIVVRLRNLEYDLTRSIKKVVSGFQSVDAVLASLQEPADLILFYTPDTLPESLQDVPETIRQEAAKIEEISDGKFIYTEIDVDDPANGISRDVLYDNYRIQPLSLGFGSSDTFYLYMVVRAGDKIQVRYPNDPSENGIRDTLEMTLQRASTGFLKSVGVWVPSPPPQQDMFGQPQQSLQQFQSFQQGLRENYEVQTINLSEGIPPDGLDVLLLIGPQFMSDLERYAVDQYLMLGGTLIVAAGNFQLAADQFGGIALQPIQGGMQDMLDSYGISVAPALVLDPVSAPFVYPDPSGQFGLMMSYPYHVSVQPEGMNNDSPIVNGLPMLNLLAVSPITVTTGEGSGRTVTVLMESSEESWTVSTPNLVPNQTLFPEYGFAVNGTQQPFQLAVLVEGRFDSFFKDKPSPFPTPPAANEEGGEAAAPPGQPEQPAAPAGILESSPGTSRIMVIGSSEFLNDIVMDLMSSLGFSDMSEPSLQLVQNAVDWATEDTDLLSIRARGSATRRIKSDISEDDQDFTQIANSAFALISVIILGVLWQARKRTEAPMPMALDFEFEDEIDDYYDDDDEDDEEDDEEEREA